ncbi:nitroreductase [Burkholderiales bacterium]|nr:nitroreductase [Burkholderiales bacterium]
MNVKTSLDDRFSCRKFKVESLEDALIKNLLRGAQKTASWCNTQPWALDIVSGVALDALSDSLVECARRGDAPNPDIDFPEEYVGVFKDRRKVCGLQLYEAVGIQRGDVEKTQEQLLENFRFFGAPHVVFISTPIDLGLYGALDCGLYISSFMLLAQESGIHTIAQAAVASYPDIVRQHLSIESSRNLLCGISFGYGDDSHPVNSYRTEREEIENVANFYS